MELPSVVTQLIALDDGEGEAKAKDMLGEHDRHTDRYSVFCWFCSYDRSIVSLMGWEKETHTNTPTGLPQKKDR